MTEPTEQRDRESYPSPRPTDGLPFYQPPEHRSHGEQANAAPTSELERQHATSAGEAAPPPPPPPAQQQQAQGQPATPHPQAEAHQDAHHEAHHEVPDDPQLRASITHQLSGSFGNFGAPPAPMGGTPTANPAAPSTPAHGVPQGSVAFAQLSNAADSAPPTMHNGKPDKRQKVSRACDECRRKKIRCDAIDESMNMPCTNCARTGARCAFSRQPLKRGPNKGYIKELAERLNSLEQQVHPGPPHIQQQRQYEIQQLQQAMAGEMQGVQHDHRLSQDPRVGDKRSHDMAEAMHNGQAPGMVGQMMPGGMQQSPPYPPYPPYQQHSPGASQPFWRHGPAENRPDTVGLSYETETLTAITNFDWDEAVIDEYYRIIHQTFPLLPHNKHRLRQKLAECPASLREACLAALDCLVRTFPTTTLSTNTEYAQALKRAAELLAKYPFDNPSSHTNATNLVYLQTLLLMALESDNHGPATIRGQAGPSRAEWLGRAAGVAGQLEINQFRGRPSSVMEGDRDSEDRLSRRAWWVLFILDRWHASSTADLLKLPENSVVLLPEDQILLGESTYHLARLSFIIGHLASILTTTKTPSTDVMSPSNPASSLLCLTLAGEIDRFRESVESVWGSLNLVHLSYHHCHLLIKRLNPETQPVELVGHAVKVAAVLNSRLTPVTPLNHHFGALAAMTLCELCDLPKTRVEAMKGLDDMAEALGEGRGLAGKLESEGWDGAVRELVRKKREKMLGDGGLQNLADAAAIAQDTGGEDSYDPTMLTRYGYLTFLGQGKFGNDFM